MLDIQFPLKIKSQDIPSLNHSFICSRILRQLFDNKAIEALTELTLDIGNGITPDICIYPSEIIHPNFSRDITRMQQIPTVAIEVISASQNIQDVLEKAEQLVNEGIKAVWTIEPYTRTVFETKKNKEDILSAQIAEFDNIKIDFLTT
ncbi:Uma2 family endonuclease [Candidatus Parabeggiatoa sp. HSG14]|uniref:Uma2 family endonuclease n=1 Tax=Candidatus Parabeggiatoa sp. HSG14 TaxID=3055593 RepID=UPI0025A71A37|nr:Uma2 family endonuclease [Thiotrichales bacterium HSG14]